MKVMITGPTGCIGNATIDCLLGSGVNEIIGMSRSASTHADPRVTMVACDITNTESVRELFIAHRPTHVIHLAGLQTPDCQANPFGGMETNVIGTANVARAAASIADGMERFVFASSAAVYGPRSMYPSDTIRASASFLPAHLYGYWKVGGEGIAQAFHMETSVPTVSVRLATTYGPGRDRGMTAAPTTAIKAVALGQPFTFPYKGREHYHFVHDVAAGFGGCAIAPFDGYAAVNLRGVTTETQRFCELLRECADERGIASNYKIETAPDASDFPFACDLNDRDILRLFPQMPLTPLKEGIARSLDYFMEAAARNQT
jgi:nucleoside-diphosphate-sugar epimerase